MRSRASCAGSRRTGVVHDRERLRLRRLRRARVRARRAAPHHAYRQLLRQAGSTAVPAGARRLRARRGRAVRRRLSLLRPGVGGGARARRPARDRRVLAAGRVASPAARLGGAAPARPGCGRAGKGVLAGRCSSTWRRTADPGGGSSGRAAADLIRETGAGTVVAPDDVDGMRAALEELHAGSSTEGSRGRARRGGTPADLAPGAGRGARRAAPYARVAPTMARLSAWLERHPEDDPHRSRPRAGCRLAAVAVLYPKAIADVGREGAIANSALSYSDREIAGGNSVVADQTAVYAARALIPADATYHVAVNPDYAGRERTHAGVRGELLPYFLMPRRPVDGRSMGHLLRLRPHRVRSRRGDRVAGGREDLDRARAMTSHALAGLAGLNALYLVAGAAFLWAVRGCHRLDRRGAARGARVHRRRRR